MQAVQSRHLLNILALTGALLLSACSNSQKLSAIDRLKPCKASDGLGDAYCGTLDVFEDRSSKSGRKIPLRIVLLPALKQKYAPDPLFFLAGGPGQGAAQLARDLQEPYRQIETDRDIVLVDQRGTGKSNPLECKPGKESDSDDEDADDDSAVMLKRLSACADSLKSKADLTKYTTPIAMDDLDDVRQYLGYSKIDIYGGSYGTRAALVYARRHPANLRAMIIDGVAPTDMRLPLYMARDGQRALDLLLRDCENDAGCNKRFPDLKTRLKTLLDRLSAHPQHVHYVHPRTGEEKDLDVKRLMLGGVLFSSLYSPMTASLVPLLIEQAEKGNYTGFFALGAAFDPTVSNMAQGMHFSVVCSEDAPRIEPGSIAREAAGTFLGAEMAEIRTRPCTYWPHEPMDPKYYENTPSDIPALILSGELDPVTPPVWGAQIAAQWKNSKHIVVPGTGHGAWASGCVMNLMAQFLNDGNASKLDASCVQKVKRPPFFLGPSGPDPMAGAQK
jgi:pimeloyl-ACP methyl ester carboxylesterase